MTLSHSPNIVTYGLVLYLDAANSKSYLGTGTTWYDLAGTNNFTLSGTYFYDDAKKCIVFNSGAQLDGTGRAEANLDLGVSPYSIDVIFMINRYKYATTNISAQIFSSGRTIGNFDEAFYLGRNGFTGEAQGAGLAWYDSGYADGPGGDSDEIYKDTIYHVVVTIQLNGSVLFYVNSNLTSTDNTTSTNFNMNGLWSIANQPTGYDEGVDSNFYCLRVYDRIISQQEIKQNFNALRGRYGI